MDEEVLKVDYSGVDEYEEVQDALRKYEDSAAKLLDAIAERDELVAALKIAHPSKIAEIRELIAEWNSLIESAEELLQDELLLVEKVRKLVRTYLELNAMNKLIEPELIKHVAEHNPEQLELLEAMLNDDGKTH